MRISLLFTSAFCIALFILGCGQAENVQQQEDSLRENGVKLLHTDSPEHTMPVVPMDTQQSDMPVLDTDNDTLQPK